MCNIIMFLTDIEVIPHSRIEGAIIMHISLYIYEAELAFVVVMVCFLFGSLLQSLSLEELCS